MGLPVIPMAGACQACGMSWLTCLAERAVPGARQVAGQLAGEPAGAVAVDEL